MGKSKNWVVWCRSRKKDEEQRLFVANGKEIFSNRSKQIKAKAGEQMDKKEGKGQSVRWKAEQPQTYDAQWAKSMLRVRFTKIAIADEQKKTCEESGRSIRSWLRKDECQVQLQGRKRDYWMSTQIGMLGGYGFQGQVTAVDGSDKKGKMGAGYNNLRRKQKKQ